MPTRLHSAIVNPTVLFWAPPNPLDTTKPPGSMAPQVSPYYPTSYHLDLITSV